MPRLQWQFYCKSGRSFILRCHCQCALLQEERHLCTTLTFATWIGWIYSSNNRRGYKIRRAKSLGIRLSTSSYCLDGVRGHGNWISYFADMNAQYLQTACNSYSELTKHALIMYLFRDRSLWEDLFFSYGVPNDHRRAPKSEDTSFSHYCRQ